MDQDRTLPPPYGILRAYLSWHAMTACAYGIALLVTPLNRITGPSLRVVYEHLSPRQWGVLFLVLAAVCLVGAIHTERLWRGAMLLLGVAEFAWALGLSLPLFMTAPMHGRQPGPLSGIAWISLAGITALVAYRANKLELRDHPRDR